MERHQTACRETTIWRVYGYLLICVDYDSILFIVVVFVCSVCLFSLKKLNSRSTYFFLQRLLDVAEHSASEQQW